RIEAAVEARVPGIRPIERGIERRTRRVPGVRRAATRPHRRRARGGGGRADRDGEGGRPVEVGGPALAAHPVRDRHLWGSGADRELREVQRWIERDLPALREDADVEHVARQKRADRSVAEAVGAASIADALVELTLAVRLVAEEVAEALERRLARAAPVR